MELDEPTVRLFGSGEHLDVYVNYVCNLRCRHCFIGERLESKRQMTWKAFEAVVGLAQSQGAVKLTLLGGEPTLWPRICDGVSLGYQAGYENVRIVTNGTRPLRRVIQRFQRSGVKPQLIFSIDGHDAATHDAVRGPGSFGELIDNMRFARSAGFRVAAIATLGPANIQDAEAIVGLAADQGCEYLNLHTSSPIGFGRSCGQVSEAEWRKLFERVVAVSRGCAIDIRMDHGFWLIPGEAGHESDCPLRRGRGSNVMVFPDGRVFLCALFLDHPGTNSFFFDGRVFRATSLQRNSIGIARRETRAGCPGHHFASGAVVTGCLYSKVTIRSGEAMRS